MAEEGLEGAQPPIELGKSLRCCVPCRLVKTFEQFYEQVRRSPVAVHSIRWYVHIVAAAHRKRPALPEHRPPPPTASPFLRHRQGCENCPFLALDGDRERIYDCTTSEFKVRP